jgi:hypothetical protein
VEVFKKFVSKRSLSPRFFVEERPPNFAIVRLHIKFNNKVQNVQKKTSVSSCEMKFSLRFKDVVILGRFYNG